MPLCYHCGKEIDYPFKCSFCGGQYCIEHRLPENHNCINQPARTPLGRWKAKKSQSERLPKTAISQIKKTEKKAKKRTTEDGEFYFIKGEDYGARTKKPIKKIIAVLLAVIIVGFVLWKSPMIISFFQSYLVHSPYTEVTVVRGEFPTVQFGDTEYTFAFRYENIGVSTPLFESETFPAIENKTHTVFGIKIKISEVQSNNVTLLIKTIIEDYLAQSPYRKLTIASGQYQRVNFSGNQYTFSYFDDKIAFSTPLMEYKEYQAQESTIHRDLGVEIRVYKVSSDYVILFVKPLY